MPNDRPCWSGRSLPNLSRQVSTDLGGPGGEPYLLPSIAGTAAYGTVGVVYQTPGAVPQARPALGVDGGQEQPADQGEVLHEEDLMPRALLLVVLLPEPVPGQRGRDERGGQGRGRRPAQAGQQEQAPDEVYRTVELDEAARVGRYPLVDPGQSRADPVRDRPGCRYQRGRG